MLRTLTIRAEMHWTTHSDVHRSSDFKDLHEKQTVESMTSQLSKFNFQIIFRSGKMNTKVDALTRMLLANVSESAQRLEDHFHTILILDRVNVLSIESKANLYQQIWMINQTDEFFSEYRQAINENKLKFHITKLKNCQIIDDVLFRKDLLWVSENMHTKLLQEVHDQSSISHFDNRWIIDQIIELLFNDTFKTVMLVSEAKSLEIASMNFIILFRFHRNAEKI